MLQFFSVVILCLLGLKGLAQSLNQPPAARTTYQNPVIAGDFADPSVIRVGDTYYAVGTSSEWGPAYPIYTSTDLVNWTYVGPVFSKLPAWTMGSYWAPELVYHNNTFFVYYTARRKSDKRSYIGVATTRDLRKGFTDHGLLLEWTSEAIDAFVLDDNGKRFITWKAYGLDKGKAIEILGAELSADGLKVIGTDFSLLKAEPNTWEAGGAEGQAIFKRGRYFYMLYSGNACCGSRCNYQVGLARAEHLQGPWEKYANNPVLTSDESWKCPGHGTVVTTPDNRYFYLHHAYNGTDFTFTGRQGVLSELVWDEKSQWPSFRYGSATPAQAESPYGIAQRRNENLLVDFRQPGPDPLWVWDVSLPKPAFTIQKGQLQVASATNNVGSFLGLVIKDGTYTLSADVSPQSDVLQSICLYGDSDNALGVGVKNSTVEMWQVKEGVRTVLNTQSIKSGTSVITLQLESRQGRYYTFSWGEPNGALSLINREPVDGSFLPRWDRAPRAGISVLGPAGKHGAVDKLQMNYK
ncbi:glycoside hydrolase family 43 protein [Spirosoma sp. KUDC1026]|uniref:glycoside hydrolase family 43 protein n=1 Tax=Spirosoma sp. KUDC1026 TaxID=2745947 RepID=UPI00159BA18F|nr:glycoside hydrolase family 43 protein [Spirosoma sp. KUDC1026]QKZ14983.1 family 43 glycosylhydrolase [Spirosoma sp. KUDC1026]